MTDFRTHPNTVFRRQDRFEGTVATTIGIIKMQTATET
jgi:hypothetical protein